jgi:hypothetical protein
MKKPIPPKGKGQWRHCYHGQEANLVKLLMDEGLSLEDFNRFWDDYEARNRDHEISDEEKSTEYRQAISQRILRIFADAKMVAEETEPFNLFVPTFAPRYQEMVERGGKFGVSLEDANREGVWVKRSWYERSSQAALRHWKRFTDDQLREIYPSKKPTLETAYDEQSGIWITKRE